MRILIFNDNTPGQINGAAEVSRHIISNLESRGNEILILSPESYDNELKDYTKNYVRLKSIKFWKYPECRIAFPSFFNSLKIIRYFQPQLILIFTPFSAGLNGLIFAKLFRIPIFSFFLTDFSSLSYYYDFKELNQLIWQVQLKILRQSKRIYVPSKYAFKLLEDRGIQNLQMFKLAPSNTYFRPKDEYEIFNNIGSWENKSLKALYVGRLAPDKSILELIKLISKINQVKLNLVGIGPNYREIMSYNVPNVSILGYQTGERLASIYRNADIFLMPSKEELGGLSIIESLSSQVPILCNNSKANKELVDQGNNGLLYNDHNDFLSKINDIMNSNILTNLKNNIKPSFNYLNWDEISLDIINSFKCLENVEGVIIKNEYSAMGDLINCI